jgi:hypothetical protein
MSERASGEDMGRDCAGWERPYMGRAAASAQR